MFSFTPELGQEYIPEGEELDIDRLVEMMTDYIERKYPPGETLRNFHPKMHGCLQGKFIVEDSLPEEYRVGLFRIPKTYDAWIRFSSAPPNVRSDKKKAGRGLAIKILNVEGEIIDPDPLGLKTQNFLMTTSPVLSSGFVSNYRRAIKALIAGFPGNLPYIIDPSNWRRLALTLKSMKKHANLLEVPYYTGSPFRFGTKGAAKFLVLPQKPAISKFSRKATDYFLRERLIEDLKTSDACFDFMVQPQTDPVKEPIEDTSYAWRNPSYKVATIHIPPQEFATQERIIFGENLSFSPWLCLKDHQPLGGINRARRRVYRELAELRKKRNGVV